MISEKIQSQITSENTSDCNLIIGRKGTGKSTYISKIIDNTEKPEIIFISPKIAKYRIINESKKVLLMNQFSLISSDLLNEEINNSLLLFDDCKQYINSNPNEHLTKKFIDFLIESRHKNNSIYFVFHSFSQVNERFFSLIDRIILFKTMDNITKFKNLFSDYETIEKNFNEINKSKNDHDSIIIDL